MKQACRTGRLFAGVLTVCLAWAAAAQAATFYVDFDAGNDSHSGRSPSSPWKRSPGDPQATAIASQTPLQPGDIVLFKGGTIYRGSISIRASGTSDQTIVFRGDGWGTEKARIEGADPWQPEWENCRAPEECFGNPDFARIYYTSAPPGYTSFRTGLYEDGDFLWTAQGPDPQDPFYYDIVSQYHRVPRGDASIRQTRTSITDPSRLTQTDPNFWTGAQIAAWVQGNTVAVKPVTGFDPVAHALAHEDLGGDPYADRDTYYALLNHPSLITRAGEYAFDPARSRIYLWPRHSDDPRGHTYSVQARHTAFSSSNRSHVVIEGFIIERFVQGVQSDSTSASGIVVRRNEISNLRSADRYAIHVNARDSLVAENRIVNCLRAVGILSSAQNIVVRDNYVSRTSRQGIWFMGAGRSQIVNNVITDIRGSHSNALSIYSSSSDILVAHNTITQANSPITYEASRNITFYGNLVDGGNSAIAATDWFGTSGRIAFINNTFVRNGGDMAIRVAGQTKAEYLVLNNILQGSAPSASRHEYNLFVRRAGAKWNGATGEEIVSSLADIFQRAEANDGQLKSGGPGVNRGVDPTMHLPVTEFPAFDFRRDLSGNIRAADGMWDLGAIELVNRGE